MTIIREPYGFVHVDQSAIKEVYGGPGGLVFIECMRIRPVGSESRSVIVFTHPVGGGAFLPLVTALAQAGRHVIYCNPRYRGNDTALILEKCVLDLGACLVDLRKRFGYESVTLGGWSGGGSLSLFYQDQAERPTITHTPAGDAVDLTAATLPPVQGVMLLAAHISRAITLTEWLDPSVTDESRPFERDRSLNIYDPACPAQPPYDADFVERFRAGQIARNRRITAWVKQSLADLKAQGQPHAERAFCTYGTMADVRWTDPTQDPSDRPPHTCYLGEPHLVNDGPAALARVSTLRSWLSQWSYDESNARGLNNAANITCPTLVVNNTADLACTPSHAQRLYDAIGHLDKEIHQIKDADHYYIYRPDRMGEAVDLITDWLGRKGL